MIRNYLRIISILIGLLLTMTGCTLAPPFNHLAAVMVEPTEEVLRTPQPTFTSTPEHTPTPTKTNTPTRTPLPTHTSTPKPPTKTATPTPSDTPTPRPTNPPPPPTDTPGPTDTPAPSWSYQVSEIFSSPTNANILSIIVAVQTHEGNWIPGYRVVGRDPNGVVSKSEPSADHQIGHSPADSSVIKSGNTKFEPQPRSIYITGTWTFYLESLDGQQVSDSFQVTMDAENRSWYFFRFQPK